MEVERIVPISLAPENADKAIVVTHADDGSTSPAQDCSIDTIKRSHRVAAAADDDKLRIQEIGQETLKRELANRVAAEEEKVRFVPIKMPDGRLLQRDPDETMEIKAEFTKFCEQQFPDTANNKPATPPPPPPPPPPRDHNNVNSERVVPIKLDSGEDFMPTFTKLDDIKTPEWFGTSASPQSSPSMQQQQQSDRKEVNRPVPIRVTSSSSREASPSRRTTTTTTKKTLTKRSSREKSSKSSRVQHTVRFKDEEEEMEAADEADNNKKTPPKRSSSLETARRQKIRTNPRERHLSASNNNNNNTEGEKTLHEIDRDINKIWQELQELDSLPSDAHKSPFRAPTAVTPVKIRTYNTPEPTSVMSTATTTAAAPPPPVRSTTAPFLHHRPLSAPSPSSSSSLSGRQPVSYSQQQPHHQHHVYSPRRDMEPTRPGAITPAYSASSPHKITKAASSTLPQPQPPATVLDKTLSEGGGVMNGSSNKNPPSLQQRSAVNKFPLTLTESPEEKTSSTGKEKAESEIESQSSPWHQADKSCQTEDILKRKSGKKCCLQ